MALTWGPGALMPKCECERNAVGWIQYIFADCIYTSWELLAFTVGLSSIACWLFAQFPQFLRNIKMRSAEALSPWFLFQWLSVCSNYSVPAAVFGTIRIQQQCLKLGVERQ